MNDKDDYNYSNNYVFKPFVKHIIEPNGLYLKYKLDPNCYVYDKIDRGSSSFSFSSLTSFDQCGKIMYLERVSDRHRHFLLAIKAMTVFACLIACIANNYAIFTQFIGKKTVTSQNVENNDGLSLPSITICSLSGFKEAMLEYKDIELDNYLNKTLNLEEVLLGYYEGANEYNLTMMKANQDVWQFTTTYSQYKGRCHTLTYKKLVREHALNLIHHLQNLLCLRNHLA